MVIARHLALHAAAFAARSVVGGSAGGGGAFSQYRYTRVVTVAADSQDDAVTDGCYPIRLPDEVGARCNKFGSDLIFVDSDEETVLPHQVFPRGHVAAVNGIVFWFCKPQAIYDADADKTIIGTVNDLGQRDVIQYDHATGKRTVTVLSTTNSVYDDHNVPALGICSDGRYLAAYTEHSGGAIKIRKSVNPGDATSWGTEKGIQPSITSNAFSYVQLWRLASEGTIGRWYLFTRESAGSDIHWNLVTSDDDFATISPVTKFIDTTGRAPYITTWSNDLDTIRMLFSDNAATPGDDNKGLYSIYYDGAWKNIDGTALGSAPYKESNINASSIIHGASDGLLKWNGEVDEDASGNPVVIYVEYDNSDDTDVQRLRHARWDGSEWIKSSVAAEGLPFMPFPSESYHSVAQFDPIDADTIYLGQAVNGIREMQRWTATDGVWSKAEDITKNSAEHNHRPLLPHGRVEGKEPYLFFNGNGAYRDFRAFETCICARPVANPAQWAMLKLDFQGASEKQVYVKYGADEESEIDPSAIGSEIGYSHFAFGTLSLSGSRSALWKLGSTDTPAMFRAGVELDDSGYWPAWIFPGNDGRQACLTIDQNLNAATKFFNLLYAEWVNDTGTKQSLISNNAGFEGHHILRIDNTNASLEFYTFLGAGDTLEQMPSEPVLSAGTPHFVYVHYDSDETAAEYGSQIDGSVTNGNSTIGGPLSPKDTTPTAVGMSKVSTYAPAHPLHGKVYFLGAGLTTLSESYRATLRSAITDEEFWTFGEEQDSGG